MARLAGVSQPTVSRALRNLPGTSPETRHGCCGRRTVVVRAQRHGPRALDQLNRRVAVVSAELDNPYYPELVEPLLRELARLGMRTVLVTGAERDPTG